MIEAVRHIGAIGFGQPAQPTHPELKRGAFPRQTVACRAPSSSSGAGPADPYAKRRAAERRRR